jgi:hypothetical protein
MDMLYTKIIVAEQLHLAWCMALCHSNQRESIRTLPNPRCTANWMCWERYIRSELTQILSTVLEYPVTTLEILNLTTPEQNLSISCRGLDHLSGKL